MEHIVQTKADSSELYSLAKEITQTSSDSDKDKLFDRLENIIETIFKNDKFDEIESALTMAAEKEELDVMSIIMDDAEMEVSHIQFEENNKEVVSSMLLLSCMMITGKDEVTIPSIGRFQEVIQAHLLKAGHITSADQFRLGAIRIDNESLEDFTMNDWWRVHRNIVNDLNTPENAQKLKVVSEAEVDSGITMFHLVPVVIGNEDGNILEGIFSADRAEEVWNLIGKELSSKEVGFNIIPPNFVASGINQSQYILQTAQLQLIIQEYTEYNNIDLAYIKTNEEGTYVVFLLDNEDNTLVNFYVFETDGNEEDFVNMLMSEAENLHSQTVWHFDVSLDLDDIEVWHEDEAVYLDDLMKHGHDIDIKQYKAFMQASSGQYLH